MSPTRRQKLQAMDIKRSRGQEDTPTPGAPCGSTDNSDDDNGGVHKNACDLTCCVCISLVVLSPPPPFRLQIQQPRGASTPTLLLTMIMSAVSRIFPPLPPPRRRQSPANAYRLHRPQPELPPLVSRPPNRQAYRFSRIRVVSEKRSFARGIPQKLSL